MAGKWGPEWNCPDCSGRLNLKNELTHDKTCPHGLALDEMRETDRQWFLDHPGETSYERPMHPAEKVIFRQSGEVPEGWEVNGTTVVTQLAEGMRSKRFKDVWMTPREGA